MDMVPWSAGPKQVTLLVWPLLFSFGTRMFFSPCASSSVLWTVFDVRRLPQKKNKQAFCEQFSNLDS